MLIDIVRKEYYILKNLKYRFHYLVTKKTPLITSGILLVGHELENRGAEKLLYNIVKWIDSKGYPVCIITFSYGPMWKEYSKFGTLITTSRHALARKLEKLKAKGYSCALCNTVTVGDVVPVLKKSGFRVVSLVHEMENVISNEFVDHAKSIVEYADEIIFPSSYVADSFCRAIGRSNFKYLIHDQGLFNTARKYAGKETERIFRDKYNIPKDYKIVLNVATASIRKGFDLFIKTSIQAQKAQQRLIFLWIGDNTQRILRKVKQEERVGDIHNLRLPGYFSSLEELNTAYACADILYLTSREDPFPSVVMDALSAGLPVVAFRKCGGFMDVVEDGRTGKLVTPFNYKMALEEIERLIENPDYDQISENCVIEAKRHSFHDYCNFLIEKLRYVSSINGENESKRGDDN